MKNRIVLALCNKTENALIPWRDAGYICVAVDIQHKPGIDKINGIYYVGADILDYLPPLGKYAFVMAFPPCTHLAVSGARWFKDKGLYALADSLKLVKKCHQIAEWTKAPYFIENPVSTLSSYWRKPDYTFNPNEYAGYLESPNTEAYTKRTCLWVGNGFVMPKILPVKPTQGSKMHSLPPTEDRSDIRSETPKGFSLAVYKYNKLKGE